MKLERCGPVNRARAKHDRRERCFDATVKRDHIARDDPGRVGIVRVERDHLKLASLPAWKVEHEPSSRGGLARGRAEPRRQEILGDLRRGGRKRDARDFSQVLLAGGARQEGKGVDTGAVGGPHQPPLRWESTLARISLNDESAAHSFGENEIPLPGTPAELKRGSRAGNEQHEREQQGRAAHDAASSGAPHGRVPSACLACPRLRGARSEKSERPRGRPVNMVPRRAGLDGWGAYIPSGRHFVNPMDGGRWRPVL